MSLCTYTYVFTVIFRRKVKKSLVKGDSDDLMKSTLSTLRERETREKKGGKLGLGGREGKRGKHTRTQTGTHAHTYITHTRIRNR